MRTRKNTPVSDLATDLVGLHYPPLAARSVSRRVAALIADVRAGRISAKEARARLRGAA